MFVNGRVLVSAAVPRFVQGLGIVGDRVAAVGATALDLVGPGTELVDLAGRLVCPGFIDAHVHPISGGLERLRCDLSELAGPAPALEAIARYAALHPEEDWIRGGGWSMTWFEGGTPAAATLDPVIADRPVFLYNRDGHGAWANSRALVAAGIDSATHDPADGRIERLPDGSPQGTLHEGAMRLVERVMPRDDESDLRAGLLEGQRYLHGHGITGWQDAWVGQAAHRVYRAAAGDALLTGRVVGALWWDRHRGLEQLEELTAMRSEGLGNYRPVTVKLMLDGVCENFSAAMLEPYLDRSGQPTSNAGLDFIDPEELKAIVQALDAAGFQCHFHAIGDRAVRAALDGVEAAVGANGWSDHRHHVAHLQVVHPEDVPRFRRLGVVANCQPLWAQHDPQMEVLTIPFLGEQRTAWQYPFGSLARAGAMVAMGSDWSVSTANVMAQAQVAVERRFHPDQGPFLPAEALTLAEVLAAFTTGSAYVNHADQETGTLEPGKLADLVVLAGNPFEADQISEVSVDLTMVGGEIVHPLPA